MIEGRHRSNLRSGARVQAPGRVRGRAWARATRRSDPRASRLVVGLRVADSVCSVVLVDRS